MVSNRQRPIVSPGMPGVPFTGYQNADAVMDLVEQVSGRNPRPLVADRSVTPMAELPSLRRAEPLVATRIPRNARPLVADPALASTENAWMIGGPRRTAPLQATRLPVAGPQLPTTAIGGTSNMPGAYPGVSQAASYVDDLAAAATGTAVEGAAAKGLLGGLGAKISGIPFPKSTAGRVGLGLGLGLAAQPVSNALGGNESFLGRFAGGAVSGAGLGAIGGPWGALGGGLAMGLYNGFFGGGEDAGGSFDKDKVVDYMSITGMGEDQQQEMFALYELEKDALGGDAAKANLMERLSLHAQERDYQEQVTAQEAQAQQRMLASQALAGQFFQPFADKMITSAQQRYQAMQNILPSLPESFRGIAASQAAGALDNATRMATAYQAQAQMIPAMASFQEQQGQVNSLAQQLLQQGIQNTLTPQTTDLSALLQGQ